MYFYIVYGKKDFTPINKYKTPSTPSRGINNSSTPPPRPMKPIRWWHIDPKIFAQPPPKFNIAGVIEDIYPEEDAEGSVVQDELKDTSLEDKVKDTSSSSSAHLNDTTLEALILKEELKATAPKQELMSPVPDSVNIPERYVELEDKFDYIHGGSREHRHRYGRRGKSKWPGSY